jgi:predicted esterase
MPPGDWLGAPEAAAQKLVATPPALFHVMGTSDPEFAAAQALAAYLKTRSVTVHLEQVPGSTSEAVLDFSVIWSWMLSPS